jgi:uncharacterized membrane protein YcjF (UPF0283 family)
MTDRNIPRLLLGLGGVGVAAAIIFAKYHWSLPMWLLYVGCGVIIVTTGFSEQIIPRTIREREEHETEILRACAAVERKGFWLYTLQFPVGILLFLVAAFILAWFYMGMPPLFVSRSSLLTVAIAFAPLIVSMYLFGVGSYWWNLRRARKMATKRQHETMERPKG